MKIYFLLTAVLLLALPAHAELTVVSAQHREADSFKRVSEYLTGKHSDGRYATFRSDESSRDGFYVSLLASKKAPLASVTKILVQFVRAGSQEIQQLTIPVETLKKKRILIGLTDSEWQGGKAHPVAWRIDLLDASENSIESATSFLWSE